LAREACKIQLSASALPVSACLRCISAECRRLSPHHRNLELVLPAMDNTALALLHRVPVRFRYIGRIVRAIATKAALAWGQEALSAELREARYIQTKRVAAGAALDRPEDRDRPFSENPDPGFESR
jgi:hypothetical protein